ncbi:hypothetical protein FS749_008562 [Ceratobasidium sp. UAMH 11750]|nr:hypothetical protein FS749_008562 [Ceratobasidium sp. UAMH 11750]
MRLILLQGGMSFNDEYAALMDLINRTISSDPGNLPEVDSDLVVNELLGVWYLRLHLKGIFNTYIMFMDNDSIPDTTHQTVRKYLDDYNYTLEDSRSALTTNGNPLLLFQILDELMYPSLNNLRYIMAMCGGTFITLASLNLIQAWPRDRFHWASILSRYAMGTVMLLLLLLNLGNSQTYAELAYTTQSQRAGLLRWADAGMVLPTLALAYITQFIIDTVLVYLAVRSSHKLSS